MLAAWLVIYAAGNLVSIADSGLQFRAINRFLAFKSSVDCDGRTARFYAAMLRIYQGLAGLLVILLLVGTQFVSPSTVLGFQAIAGFDTAFVVMTAGMLLTLPSNLVSGLYRARGLYGRAVKAQNVAMLAGQVGQLVAIVTTQSLLAVTLAYVASQVAVAVYLFVLDAPRLFPFLRRIRVRLGARWVLGQFRIGCPVCRRKCDRACLAQPARIAGQRPCVRSRRRYAMGPHPRRRGAAAGALHAGDASPGGRARPRLCLGFERASCGASIRAGRCS